MAACSSNLTVGEKLGSLLGVSDLLGHNGLNSRSFKFCIILAGYSIFNVQKKTKAGS